MRLAAALAACALLSPAAQACSSCGCTLSSDWASQGLEAAEGASVTLRHDAFVQDDLRSGTRRVGRDRYSYPTDEEIQQRTENQNTTLTVDDGFSADWGVSVQVPFYNRDHTTIAPGDTAVSRSHSASLGDVRLTGRYQGLSADHDWGLLLGLKLPTGRTDVDFAGGPQAGEPLDRGLQPGTGSTDLLVGIDTFGPAATAFDYFAQALLQVPVASAAGFRPGTGFNLNAGVRYLGAGAFVPHVQVNLRREGRESGVDADVADSGATLVYLGPGATVAMGRAWKVFGFLQVPVYQRVNGLQLEPRISLSMGLSARL